MKADHERHTVLVPIMGEDISADAYVRARSLLAEPDSRLVLLHIRTPNDPESAPTTPTVSSEPRWHRLACAVPTDRTFIDAVVGDPATEIPAEADRFHTHTIVF